MNERQTFIIPTFSHESAIIVMKEELLFREKIRADFDESEKSTFVSCLDFDDESDEKTETLNVQESTSKQIVQPNSDQSESIF